MTENKPVRRPMRTKARTNRLTAVKPATVKPSARRVKASRPAPMIFAPPAAGQIWQLGEANLKVEMVGKLLLHYKLAKPNAVRTPTSIAGISTMMKYMKKNKAVLISG